MVVAVNTRFLLKGKLEGIGWFTHQMLQRIVVNNPQHKFIFIFDRPFEQEFIFGDNVKPIIVGPPARHPFLWWLWFEIQIPRILQKYKADVFLSTDGFASLQTKVPQVLVIHDLVFEHYPNYVPKLIGTYLRYFTKKFVHKATNIIAVSEYTKQDVISTYKVNSNKVHKIYNGAHSYYKPLTPQQIIEVKNKYTEGKSYFVYAGSLHPRKNIVGLLKAFAKFKKMSKSGLQLLLIGRLAWLTEEIELTLNTHPYKSDIIRIEYLDADDLSKIIGAAYAMVYVSNFEGFGIPILEAIKCNVPVITSNVTSMPEVVGAAGLTIDPKDENAIASAMLQLYNDENLRNKLIANCHNQASKFNWDNSATELMQLIEQTIYK